MNMRIILAIVLSLLLPEIVDAQIYVPEAQGCKVEFRVTNKKGEVIKGNLNNVKGKITFDPKQLSTASFDIGVGLGGIASGRSKIDVELKKENYFNPAKYPLIKIKSTSVTQDKPGGPVYILHGNLTIKGTTKPVNIQFMATPVGDGYLFRGTLQLSRAAFDVGSKGDGVEDNVSVFIEVRAKKG